MADIVQSENNIITATQPLLGRGFAFNGAIAWLSRNQRAELFFLPPSIPQFLNIPTGKWINATSLWQQIIHPDDYETVSKTLIEEGFKEHHLTIKFRIQLSNQQYIRVEASEINLEKLDDDMVLGLIQFKPELELPSHLESPNISQIPIYDALPGLVFRREINYQWQMNYLSAGCHALTGYDAYTLIELNKPSFDDLIHPEDYIDLSSTLSLFSNSQNIYSIEYRIQDKNQQFRWVLEKGKGEFDQNQRLIGFSGLITDITETKKAQQQLQHDAFYDKLTTLPNRSLFMDRLERLLKRTKRRPEYCFAVFFLDLDRFKLINDSLGHRAGDTLLIESAKRLESCLRPGDTVARLGGDEFTMLIDDIQETADVIQISDRILEEMQQPFEIEGHEIYSSTSIGIALSSIGYSEADEILRDADIALYQAKALGKARYAIFNPGMHIHAVARLQLENDLQKALSNRELRLYYQPIVSLETGIVEGLEAFVYWQHPDRGLIGPSEFIPVAESNGTMIEIGQWVLSQSIQQVSIWHQTFPCDPPIFICVNLSATEILDNFLPKRIQSILAEVDLDPRSLKVEISEKTFLEQPDSIIDSLNHLRQLGVQICIDDFGTGYSALSYVNQFPVDIIKIDRSFISRIDIKENLEIVRTILTLAESLGFQVVAEGVETVTQLAQLRALGCEWGQGYCLARPLEAKLVETCLLQEPSGDITSSISASLPRLLVRSQSGQYHLLLMGRTSWQIGRGQESSIFLADRMVSREHAILLQLARTGDFFFVDLGSRNGSFLNDNRIETPVLLKEGDRIRIGKTELEYRDLPAPSREGNAEFPYKLVLIQQAYKLQGEIWREILISQGISVIWFSEDGNLFETLAQLENSGEILPDLLLLEISTLKPDADTVLKALKTQYPALKLILTSGREVEIHETQLKWAQSQHDSTLLPGFNLRGNDLKSNSADIAKNIQLLLDELDCFPPKDQLAEAAYVALQLVIRNETLY